MHPVNDIRARRESAANHPRRPSAIILTDKVDSIIGNRICHLLAIMSAHWPCYNVINSLLISLQQQLDYLASGRTDLFDLDSDKMRDNDTTPYVSI
ncbi:hypothetical protein Zmor_026421 [Zophobas morio]|uniref:Uncharacterized protein n=1 Tax=Zophobas morio TaxID=2755281 RepID=A0AA38HVA9_9CUCU|nr:hypothetical protein Zmor_026421 [Zophobas morio]